MIFDRKKILDEFARYTNEYDATNPKIKLKIDHTYRVASLCERIAKSINLSAEDVDLAWCSGMLHDIGRFEQLRRFNTFVDSKSIDHARFGIELLFGPDRLIDSFFDDTENEEFFHLLYTAIYYHSDYRLPEELTEREVMFANILRDADKVDIFRVNIDTPLEDIYNVTTEELMNSQVSPEVMEAFREEHAILRELKHTAIDNVVGHMALFFELVYPYSLEATRTQGYYDKLLGFVSENDSTNKQLEEIRGMVNEFYQRKKR
ncbi:MAG: HD domain-containing protein [Lachnospiraceae bacterium]|nr:HD domain-containing protein [Lachnospiraceae bacterium]